MRLGLALVSILLPGEAHGQVDRPRAALVWALAGALTLLLAPLTIWALFASLAVRLACGVTSFVQLGGVPRTGGWGTKAALTATVVGIAPLAVAAITLQTFRAPSSSMLPTIDIGDHVLVSRFPYWIGSPKPGDVIEFDQPCEPNRQYFKRVIATGGQTVEVRCSVVYIDGKPLPAALVDAQATYDDYDEMNKKWFPRPASAYDETLGDRTYRIYAPPDRPKATSDMHDFPRLDGGREPPSCASDPMSRGATIQKPGELVETKHDAQPCEPQLHYVVPADHLFVLGDNRGNSNDSRYWGSVPISLVSGRAIGIFRAEHAGWGHVGPIR